MRRGISLRTRTDNDDRRRGLSAFAWNSRRKRSSRSLTFLNGRLIIQHEALLVSFLISLAHFHFHQFIGVAHFVRFRFLFVLPSGLRVQCSPSETRTYVYERVRSDRPFGCLPANDFLISVPCRRFGHRFAQSIAHFSLEDDVCRSKTNFRSYDDLLGKE